jgi:hypothetical protein
VSADEPKGADVAKPPLVPRRPATGWAAREAQARRRLWHPDLIEALVEAAEGDLDAGRRLTPRLRVTRFFEPALAFQGRWGHKGPHLVKEALQITVERCEGLRRRDSAGRPRPRWLPFAEAVARSRAARLGGPRPGSNEEARQAASPEALMAAAGDRLRRCYELNVAHEGREAQAILSRLLSTGVPLLAPIVTAGDEAQMRARVVECFKQGSSDLRGVVPNAPYAACDFLPESTWPHTVVRKASSPRPADPRPSPAAVPVEASAAAGAGMAVEAPDAASDSACTAPSP